MRKIRVGIIGMGFIGKLQYEALKRIDEVEITAVSSRHLSQESFPESVNVYSSWEDLIEDPRVDAVHDCLSPALHKVVNIAAIRAGKHIYSEKPLGMNAADVRAQLSELAGNPVANAVGHQYRANAAVREMKERIQSGQCGSVLFFTGCYSQDSLAYPTDYSARRLPENSRARALSDLGSHLIDISSYVLGSSVRRVSARMMTHYPERAGHRITSDDTTFLLVELENGCCGSLVITKAAHGHKNDLRLTVSCSEKEIGWAQQVPDRLYEASRTEGNRVLFADRNTFSAQTSDLITLPAGHVMGWNDALANNMRLFYRSILDGSFCGGQEYATFADAYRTAAVIDAALSSSDSGRWEEVEA